MSNADIVRALEIIEKGVMTMTTLASNHEREVQERLFNGDTTLTISEASECLLYSDNDYEYYYEDDDDFEGEDVDNEIEFLVDCN